MDTTALHSAYDRLLDVAARPDLGDPDDAGWDADQVLAHVLAVDAGIAAVALAVVSGSRPTFDNRVSLDPWNLRRIIGEHGGRPELIQHVRDQAAVLCAIAEQLGDDATSVLVPSLLLSNDAVLVDQPVPLGGLIDGLAEDHLPEHTQQLLDLRVPGPGPRVG